LDLEPLDLGAKFSYACEQDCALVTKRLDLGAEFVVFAAERFSLNLCALRTERILEYRMLTTNFASRICLGIHNHHYLYLNESGQARAEGHDPWRG
jgi:hypothetical protein